MTGRGAVVVTGASTGIGRATALHLAGLGFHVFAGVRRAGDGEAVAAAGPPGAIAPLILDVTDAASIRAAAEQVAGATGDRGLQGLVNNAGVAAAAPLEIIPLDELRRQLEVNVVGQVAVTQALLPLLRKARGRIVNIGSIGGLVAVPVVGAYGASKFAMEAVTDVLRRELHPWGIWVAVIEPGAIATPIWEKSLAAAERTLERIPPRRQELYADQIAAGRAATAATAERAIPAQRVAEKVARALTARRPRARYLIGADTRIQLALQRLLPARAFDALLRRVMPM